MKERKVIDAFHLSYTLTIYKYSFLPDKSPAEETGCNVPTTIFLK